MNFIFHQAIDQIIGCGERHRKKYFLVRYRGENENKIIDWEKAKQYSLEVMEFFGRRLVWSSIENIIDPENVDEFNEDTDNEQNKDVQIPPTTQKNNPPNEIEYESD